MRTEIISLADRSDTLRLLLQVSNFSHTKGGTYKNILLGDAESLYLRYGQYKAFDLILVGCLFMGGLLFLGLYLFGRNDKAILFFALFSIIYSYRMIGSDRYVLQTLFPGLDWFVTIRIEYLSLTLSVAWFAKYIHALYPRDANIRVLRLLEAVCYVYSLVIIIAPPIVFTGYMTLFLGFMFIYIGYAMYIYMQAVRQKRVGSIFALASTALVLMIFLILNLQYFGLVGRFKTVIFIGYVLFFLLQSLILSARFAHALKRSTEAAKLGLKVKSDFLSTMSHEIRTPLNAVIGMAHVLRQSDPRPNQQKHLDVLMFSAKNLLSIVNNILDYSKIESGKISFEYIEVNIGQMMENIVRGFEPLAKEKDLLMECAVDKNIPLIIGDPTRISQVITNLVHNAVKFTDKGSVRVSVIVIGGFDDVPVRLQFSVTDTGIGIEPAKQRLIFERFTQADSSTSRSYGGTGLGLTICKKILELQDVQLRLNSTVGKGSEFYFVQNFSPAEKISVYKPKITEQEGTPLKDICILLVEDNEMNVLVAQAFLERSGAQVEVAINGKEALEKFDPSRHHIVLMDLQMPEMDGYEATRLMKPLANGIPIIALTASLPAEVQTEVLEAGFDDILVKPFDPDELLSKLMLFIPNKKVA